MKTGASPRRAAAVDLLRRDPHDPIGRGMLGAGRRRRARRARARLAAAADDGVRPAALRRSDGARDVGRRAAQGVPDPGPPVWPLRTERLVLRPFEPADADAFVEAWASEEWTSLLLSRPMNRAEVVEMVRRRTAARRRPVRRHGRRARRHRGRRLDAASCRAPGSARARSAGRSCRSTPGTATPPRPPGRCSGWPSSTTACAASSPTSTRATTAPPPSAERLGMRLECHRLGDFWSKGVWTDSFEYALLADEWRAGQA